MRPINSGTSRIESTIAVGVTREESASARYLPVRTSTPGSPAAIAPATSASTSSPIMIARSTPRSATAASKNARAGLGNTVASRVDRVNLLALRISLQHPTADHGAHGGKSHAIEFVFYHDLFRLGALRYR